MNRQEAVETVEKILKEHPDVIGSMARRVLEENFKHVADILDRINEIENGVLRFDVRVHQKKVTDVVISKSDRIVYK